MNCPVHPNAYAVACLLAISQSLAAAAAAFDWERRDSCDQILAAQTRLEHCALVSTDVVFDAVLHERV